jgi:hypothetical protein
MAWIVFFFITASYVAEMTGTHHDIQLLTEMGFLELPA